jgi:hypothetical protein
MLWTFVLTYLKVRRLPVYLRAKLVPDVWSVVDIRSIIELEKRQWMVGPSNGYRHGKPSKWIGMLEPMFFQHSSTTISYSPIEITLRPSAQWSQTTNPITES